MNSKTIIVLALLCAAAAWFGLRDDTAGRGAAVVENPTPFQDLDLSAVARVDLEKGKEKLSLYHAGGALTAFKDDLAFPADAQKLGAFVRAVGELRVTDRKPAVEDKRLADYGLDAASEPVVVVLADSGNRELARLLLGKSRKGKPKAGPFPFEPEVGRYLRIGAGKDVLLCQSGLQAELAPGTWMKTSLAKVDKADVGGIELSVPGKSLAFAREVREVRESTDPSVAPRKDKYWKVEGDTPEGRALDANGMEMFLDRIAEITAMEPVSPKKKAELPAAWPCRLRVQANGKTAYEVAAVLSGGDWYVEVAGQAGVLYKVSKWAMEEIFAHDFFRLGERKTDVAGVTGVSWTREGADEIRLSTVDGAWRLDGLPAVPALVPTVQSDLFQALAKVTLQDFRRLKEPPKVQATLVVTSSGAGKLEVADLGPVDLKEGRLVRFSGDPNLYVIPKAEHAKLFPAQSELLKIAVDPAGAADLSGVEFPDFKLAKEGDAWTVRSGAESKPASKEAVEAWFATYRDIGRSPYAPAGATFQPEAFVKLVGADGRIFTVTIGPMKDNIVPCRHAAYGGVFKARGELVRAFLKKAADFVAPEKPLGPEPAPGANLIQATTPAAAQ